jgi:hypothetical protein
MRVDAGSQPLVTERLLLRRSLPEDAEAISAYRRDPEVHRFQGWDRTDVEGVRAEIRRMADRAAGEDGGWVQFSVLEREGGRLIGDVGFSPAAGELGVVKIGYTIDPAFQRRGYATGPSGLSSGTCSTRSAPRSSGPRERGQRALDTRGREGPACVWSSGSSGDGHDVWHGVRYERRRDGSHTV